MAADQDYERDEGVDEGAWAPDERAALAPTPPQAGQAPAEQPPAVDPHQEPAQESTPSVELGSAVHFVLPVGPYKGVDRLAIVTRVPDKDEGLAPGTVDLHVFGLPSDHPNVSTTHLVHFAERVAYSEDRQPGTWHWADRSGSARA